VVNNFQLGIQIAFDALLALAGALAALVIRSIQEQLADMRKSHTDLRDSLPSTYARRDDVKDKFDQVMDALVRIEEKLDRKVDK